MSDKKTAVVTGAAGGIGAGLVEGFLKQGYNVVATYLNAKQSLTASPSLVLVDGDIGKQETAVKAVEAAIKRFGTIDVLVNKAPLNFSVFSAAGGALLLGVCANFPFSLDELLQRNRQGK